MLSGLEKSQPRSVALFVTRRCERQSTVERRGIKLTYVINVTRRRYDERETLTRDAEAERWGMGSIHVVLWTLVAVGISSPIFADDSPQWVSLLRDVDTEKHAVAGNWRKSDGALTTDATRSSRLTLPFQPQSEYDFRVKFTRDSGSDSIALMFVAGRGQATFEIDAWGQHLAGLQNINRRSIRENPTRSTMALKNGRAYTALVEVRKDRVRAYLDDKLIVDYKTDGSDLGMLDLWRLNDAKSLGVGAYNARTTFHAIEVRAARGGTILAATPSTPPNTKPAPSRPASPSRPAKKSGKRVLLVIANHHFFYREYHDPREELQRAGIAVDVAAGRKQMCYPHSNSGQQGDGGVMPDLAIADADVSRYDAIMFSGGWGSSMYQYAFRGSYNDRNYNGDRQTKSAVNKLIGEFVKEDKYVGALCHGVSVLAWCRVNGKSVLDGRRAVASPRKSPSGVYNGRRGQPLSRWNAEVNGARLRPARSIGDPRTSADDVMVDGKFLTGEDDNSARLFGATLAKLLTAETN